MGFFANLSTGISLPYLNNQKKTGKKYITNKTGSLTHSITKKWDD
jgi:hypothetical protein